VEKFPVQRALLHTSNKKKVKNHKLIIKLLLPIHSPLENTKFRSQSQRGPKKYAHVEFAAHVEQKLSILV